MFEFNIVSSMPNAF